MLKVLHTADIHLDAAFNFLGSQGEAHRQHIRNAFQRIVRMAQEDQYDILLIVGDLFDNDDPNRSTIRFVEKVLSSVQIPICILPGNHDCYTAHSVYHSLKLPAHVKLFTKCPESIDFPGLNLTVAGNPHLRKNDQTPPLRNIVRSDDTLRWFIALAHGNMQSDRFKNSSRPIELEHISATQADYVAMGDWHRFAEYTSGGVRAYYCGAPEPTAISQTSTGKVVSVTLSESGVQVEPITVGYVQARSTQLDVSGLNEGDVVSRLIADSGQHIMQQTELTGLKSAENLLDLQVIQESAADHFYWLKITDESTLEVANLSVDDFPEEMVIGQFVRMVATEIESAKDPEAKRIAERALQLGVALLQGKRGV